MYSAYVNFGSKKNGIWSVVSCTPHMSMGRVVLSPGRVKIFIVSKKQIQTQLI